MLKLNKRACQDFISRWRRDHPKCAACGKLISASNSEFDHVRGTKIDNVSDLVMLGYLEILEVEVREKCELVCFDCHAVRTRTRPREAEASPMPLFALKPKPRSELLDLEPIARTIETYWVEQGAQRDPKLRQLIMELAAEFVRYFDMPMAILRAEDEALVAACEAHERAWRDLQAARCNVLAANQQYDNCFKTPLRARFDRVIHGFDLEAAIDKINAVVWPRLVTGVALAGFFKKFVTTMLEEMRAAGLWKDIFENSTTARSPLEIN